MRPLKVLVADDHRLILEAIQLVLEDDEGIEVVGEATDGSQVLPLVGRTSPDVVLLDLSMPKMDGLTCLDQLRKRYPDVTVVVLSGQDDPETIRSALARGAKCFIAKLVDPHDLPSALRLAAQGAIYRAVEEAEATGEGEAEKAGLTPSEQRVLEALARGLSNREIAERLVISPKTVGNHVEHIYAKIGASTRATASLFALRQGLLPEERLAG
jgi:DNA-binding NarL/FixJ family response regulator